MRLLSRLAAPSRRLVRLFRDVRGGTAIEYGLILALIVIAMFASLQGVANVTINMWNHVTTSSVRVL